MNIPIHIIQNYIFQNFQKCRFSSGSKEINAICSICGDSKKYPGKKRRFNYNLMKNVWHCFNCDAKGQDFISLVAAVEKIPYQKAKQKFGNYVFQNPDMLFSKSKKIVQDKITKKSIDYRKFLNEDCFPITKLVKSVVLKSLRTRAINEVRKRGIEILDYPFYICYRGSYNRRLIIPFFKKDKVIYFQGRSLSDKIFPKYKNSSESKEQIILFEDSFHPDKDIFVFEGFWEALIFEKYLNLNGTTCLGKEVSQVFFKTLLDKTSKNIIFCFDNDEAGKNAIKNVIYNFREYQSRIKFFLLKGDIKDICNLWSLSKNVEKLKFFIEQNTFSFYNTKVRIQINNNE